MSTTMNRLLCNLRYCMMFFLAMAIRTSEGQAPAPAPAISPPAPAVLSPAPAGPPNITAILEKGSEFDTLIKLMRSTPVANQLDGELNSTNDFRTIFAPTDTAFSQLAPGTLNGLSDGEKTSLLEFHILPTYVPLSRFYSLSNPVSTNAGNTGKYAYPLNVSSTVNNTIDISTGIVNATITGTVFTDGQLFVYRVDKVLLPMAIFGPKAPPAPAPAPVVPEKSPDVTPPPPVVTSGDMGLRQNAVVVLVGAAVAVLWL